MIGHVAPKLSLGHLAIDLTQVGRVLGLGLKLLQKNPIFTFKFSLLGGAYVISSSHMAIKKIEYVYYTKPTYLYIF
jgi:hypothetical protein